MSLHQLRDAVRASTDKLARAERDSGEQVASDRRRLETFRPTIPKKMAPEIEIKFFLFSRLQQGKAGPQPPRAAGKLSEALRA